MAFPFLQAYGWIRASALHMHVVSSSQEMQNLPYQMLPLQKTSCFSTCILSNGKLKFPGDF